MVEKRKLEACAEKLLNDHVKKVRIDWNSDDKVGTKIRVCQDDKTEGRIFPNREFKFPQAHIKIESNPTDKHFKCLQCPKSFKFYLSLILHLKVEHGDSNSIESEVKCEICQETFQEEKLKLSHINNFHYGREGINVTVGNVGEFCKPNTLVKIRVRNVPSQTDIFAARSVRNHLIDSRVQSKFKGLKMTARQNEICGQCLKCQAGLRSHHECVMHFRNHRRTRVESLKVLCLICPQEKEMIFSSASQFGRHLEEIHPSQFPNFRCNFCLLAFTTAPELVNHKRGMHPTFPHFKCGECGIKFYEKSVMEHHSTREHGGSVQNCTICCKSVKSSQLIAHMKLAHNMDKNGVELPPERHQRMTRLNSVGGTRMQNSANPDEVFGCVKCSKAFGSFKQASNHFRQNTLCDHAQCKLCKAKPFVTLLDLKKHVDKLHSMIYQHFRCDHCTFGTSTSSDLAKHIIVEHPEIEHFSCTACNSDKVFFNQEELNNHMEQVHKDKEKAYGCNFCNDTITGKAKFKAHVRNQHGLDFKCYECGAVVASKINLRKHEEAHRKNAKETEQDDFIEESDNEEQIENPTQDASKRKNLRMKLKTKFYNDKGVLLRKQARLEKMIENNEYFDENEKKAVEEKLKEFDMPFPEWYEINKDRNLLNLEPNAKPDDFLKQREKSERDWSAWVDKLAAEVFIDAATLAQIKVYPKNLIELAKDDPNGVQFTPKLTSCGKDRKARDTRVKCQICSNIIASRKNLKDHISHAHLGRKAEVCEACGTRLINKKSLNRHQKSCAKYLAGCTKVEEAVENPKLKCRHCGLGLSTKEDLNQHLASMHSVTTEDEPLTCPTCHMVISNIHHLRKHQVNVHKQYEMLPFQCSHCHGRYVSQFSLIEHIRKKHGTEARADNGSLACPSRECTFETLSQLELIDHFKQAHDSLPYECDNCDQKFVTDFSLTKHRSSVHPGEISPENVCAQCNKSFTLRSSYLRHTKQKICQPAEERPKFVCNECGMSYLSNSKLNEHINIVHKNMKHTCHVCGAQLARRRSLKKHMKALHNMELDDLTVVCDKCGKGFANNSTLRIHLNRNMCEKQPNGKPEIKCDYCDKVLRYPYELKTHVEIVHQNMRWNCEKCGKSYKHPVSLQAHQKRCGQPKSEDFQASFACEHCGKIYLHETSLKAHMKKCPRNEALPSSSSMSLQLSTCGICDKSFANKRYLRDHQREEHGEVTDDDYSEEEESDDEEDHEETEAAVNSIPVFV